MSEQDNQGARTESDAGTGHQVNGQTGNQADKQSSSQETPYPLATRMQRLAAALLDDFIAVLTLIPMMSYYDLFSYIEAEKIIPINMIISINLYAFMMFLLLHGFLLYNYGQTIGKKVVGIAISTYDFQVPNFNRLIAFRYVPFRVAGLLPGLNVLPIVDVLFIFRKDKQCIHDMLAKTQVIHVGGQSGEVS